MLKKIIAIAALVLVPFAAAAGQLPDYPFIHANGSSWAYVPPDVGEIDFEIWGGHSNPEAARQLVEERINEVRALLTGLGLPVADIEIRDVRKEMRKGEPVGGAAQYDIKCGVHIKVADLSKWKPVVSGLLNMANLDGFMTGFDTSRRTQVDAELIGEAIKVARGKAEAMAAGFGRKLGAVGGISPGELKNLTRAMGMAASDPAARFTRAVGKSEYERDSLLMINIIKLSQSVDVIFKIK
ncbi:SIMPL domain-containing protein [Massilia sp. TWR1-2-2]|uniref:SIMPL domain-containing protein n=1 Tax=Massilia sp. TWR1-2-2 TaxID=2804584 RepID=UPI003CECE112